MESHLTKNFLPQLTFSLFLAPSLLLLLTTGLHALCHSHMSSFAEREGATALVSFGPLLRK